MRGALAPLIGIKRVDVARGHKRFAVWHDPTQVEVATILSALTEAGEPAKPVGRQDVSTALEWTGGHEAPRSSSWQTTLARPDEPGERLFMRGRILNDDGAPAAGVLLYVYHTSAAGAYPRRGNEKGNGRRHGYLRGWMRTDSDGRYEFHTIRPAPYPSRDAPAHIHATVTVPGQPERWIDSYWFEGDPLITTKRRASIPGRGGPGAIVTLRRGENGAWHGKRNIHLADWPWKPGER